MVHGSQNRGSWASWGPTIIFSEKKSPYLNNLSLDLIHAQSVISLFQPNMSCKIIQQSMETRDHFLVVYVATLLKLEMVYTATKELMSIKGNFCASNVEKASQHQAI